SKEMMEIIRYMRTVGLTICSDNTDFSQGDYLTSYGYAYMKSAELDPDNQNPPIYNSLMIKGTDTNTERSQGVAFQFKTGFMYKDATTNAMPQLQEVSGIGEYYDFASDYNEEPEYTDIKKLTTENLIHSIHFNYPTSTGSASESLQLPAETELLMLVGNDYIGQDVQWVYMNGNKDALSTIGTYKVDPFGGLNIDLDVGVSSGGTAADGTVISRLYENTALLGDPAPTPGPDDPEPTPDPSPTPDGSDSTTRTGDPGVPTWVIIAMILAALGIATTIITAKRRQH
ncbi:MAG: hypothetical protein Q4C25_09580, partial [Bacillota bacterium]|nr:hypothetical protein [Bacillota bacterium]